MRPFIIIISIFLMWLIFFSVSLYQDMVTVINDLLGEHILRMRNNMCDAYDVIKIKIDNFGLQQRRNTFLATSTIQTTYRAVFPEHDRTINVFILVV